MNPQAQPAPKVEIAPSQTPTPSPAPSAAKGGWLTILAVILAVVAVALVGLAVYLYSTGKTISELFSTPTENADSGDQDGGDSSMDGDNQSDNGEATITYNGEYITAELPEGWVVSEYYDGEGGAIMVEGPVYEGLTGITVSNPDEEVVFELGAVMGVGGTDACSEFFQFADTSEGYYDEVLALAVSEEMGPPTITDFTSTDYTEFSFFEKAIRRIGTTLYWDKTPATASFDAACGMNHGLWSLDHLYFLADETESNSYQAKVTAGTPEAELLILDEILASFAPKP